ncbi:hypothetical protein, partial [Pseudoalteromonas lipolytica]
AGTLVIYDDELQERPLLPKGDVSIPAVSLTTEEQLAVLAFAERHNELSAARHLEIATILAEPLASNETDIEEQLASYARYFAGQLHDNHDHPHVESQQ